MVDIKITLSDYYKADPLNVVAEEPKKYKEFACQILCDNITRFPDKWFVDSLSIPYSPGTPNLITVDKQGVSVCITVYEGIIRVTTRENLSANTISFSGDLAKKLWQVYADRVYGDDLPELPFLMDESYAIINLISYLYSD